MTLFFPLVLVVPYYLEKQEHQKYLTKITKIIFLLGGIFFLGGIMWFGIMFILRIINILNTEAKWFSLWFILSIIFSYGLGAFISYLIGKKRNWRPPKRFVAEIKGQFKDETEDKILIKISSDQEMWIQKLNVYSKYKKEENIIQVFLINIWELTKENTNS
jgi:hypothetical protein